MSRISNWWHGQYTEPTEGSVDDPPLCQCGHYYEIHDEDRCGNWAADQWATLGRIRIALRCQCRIGFTHDVPAETTGSAVIGSREATS